MATVVRFRKSRDDRSAMMAIISQHAGKSVWEGRIKDATDFLTRRKWNGLSSVTLERHLDKQRMSFVALYEASVHVQHQLPQEQTRVTYLLGSIKSKDVEVSTAASAVRQNDPGMRGDVETADAFLLPTCPVQKKHPKKNGPNAEIASLKPNLKGVHGKRAWNYVGGLERNF